MRDTRDDVVFRAAGGHICIAGMNEVTWSNDPYAVAELDVTVDALAIVGSRRAAFFHGDLLRFLRDFESAHRTLQGEASLASEDQGFHLRICYGPRAVCLSGLLTPGTHSKHEFHFSFDTDQSYMSEPFAAATSMIGHMEASHS
jgi:hypothetical protein